MQFCDSDVVYLDVNLLMTTKFVACICSLATTKKVINTFNLKTKNLYIDFNKNLRFSFSISHIFKNKKSELWI